MWRVLASAFFVVSIGGCTINTPATETVLRDDQFLPYLEFSTPLYPGGAPHTQMALIARRDRKSGTLTTYAMLAVGYLGLTRTYEQARNQRTDQLRLRKIRHLGQQCRQGASCAHTEVVEVELPEPDLRRALAAREGYPVKLFARTGVPVLFPFAHVHIAQLFGSVDAGKTAPAPAMSDPAPLAQGPPAR